MTGEKAFERTGVSLLSSLVFALLVPLSSASAEPIVFLSTQLTPLPEAAMMRQVILKGFPQAVDFEPYDRVAYYARVRDLVSHPCSVAILGGVQEDFLTLYRTGALSSVETILSRLPNRAFLPRFSGRGVLASDGAYFVPWMQATYLMAANKRALKYLPPSVNVDRLTYDDLRRWAANMYRATGRGMLGFPVGPKGLMPRFLQGYLYPSFTGSMIDGFAGSEAIVMWQYLRDLWRYVGKSSLILNRMDRALLNGEVGVAWDHSARLLQTFKERPDDFVAFPAPIGPHGRGFMSVLAGLGVPRGASQEAAGELIEYLTQPRVQIQTMESVGFLPVVEISDTNQLSKSMLAVMRAVTEQLGSQNGILTSAPLPSADAGRGFDLAYLVAFSQIVLRGSSIEAVLEAQEGKLRAAETKDRPVASEGRGH